MDALILHQVCKVSSPLLVFSLITTYNKIILLTFSKEGS